jgi:uncharacterized protein
MLEERLPVRLDPVRLAETGRTLRGHLQLADLSRLAESLVDAEGPVAVELAFGIDPVGVRYMQGRIEAQVRLICQRCMEPMEYRLEANLNVGLVSDEAQAELLPESYEPMLIGHEPLFLQDIVEDELILSLPIVPRHDPDRCPATRVLEQATGGEEEDVEEGEVENPFAVLAKLKHDT